MISLAAGAAVQLLKWWLSSKDRERLKLAIREIDRIKEYSDAEIEAAQAAHDAARNNPNAGRM